MTSAPPSKGARRVGPAGDLRPLPSQLGPYTLFDCIGRGGMADLYLARTRTELGASRLVVIKEVRPALAADEHFGEMLVAEARLAAGLSHPNIVSVEQLGREQGALYLAMEYVEGLDLRELLREGSRRRLSLPVPFALAVVADVLRALDYAHRATDEQHRSLGVVHRDVSPSNVLLSFEGEVKLCDFGIAIAASAKAVPPQSVEGKAGYMSPEHARGEPIDARADVFSAGVILWELLSGRRMLRPHPGERLIDVARRGRVPALTPLGVPRGHELRAIVARALEVDRAERYPSAGDMLGDLEEYRAGTKARLSPMKRGQWLDERFGAQKLVRRRARERVVAALDRGPAVVLEPITEEPAELQDTPAPPSTAAAADRQPGSAGRQRPAIEPTQPAWTVLGWALLACAVTLAALWLVASLGA